MNIYSYLKNLIERNCIIEKTSNYHIICLINDFVGMINLYHTYRIFCWKCPEWMQRTTAWLWTKWRVCLRWVIAPWISWLRSWAVSPTPSSYTTSSTPNPQKPQTNHKNPPKGTLNEGSNESAEQGWLTHMQSPTNAIFVLRIKFWAIYLLFCQNKFVLSILLFRNCIYSIQLNFNKFNYNRLICIDILGGNGEKTTY